MNILVACEESQTVCCAFRQKGHNAFSCDIVECSGGHPEWHICQDVIPLLNGDGYMFKTLDGIEHFVEKWDMIIAHPPCQYLTNSGTQYTNIAKWGDKAIERRQKREEAFNFFLKFTNADCERICIENPTGYVNTHYRKPDQIIHPWHFGHPYTKNTCLWLKGLPKLVPLVTEQPENLVSYAYATMYDDRGKAIAWNSELNRTLRSKTFQGFADAMAEQWE